MRKRGLLCLIAAALLMTGSPAVWAKPPAATAEQRDDLYRQLKVLAEAMEAIQKNYVEPVKPKDLVYGAIEGMLSRLDPHSSFMTAEMFQEMQVETEGAFGGLGIEVTMKDGQLTVVSPIEGTPAYAAGIQAGDVIVMIEGQPTRDMNLNEAVKRMRGPRGTKVTIEIMRAGFKNPKPFTITRDVIRIKSVRSRRLDNIGVVRIAQFQQGTNLEVRKAIKNLEQGGPLDGIILDLRNDPGGLLDQAVKVADIFLKSGTVVSTRGRDPEQEVAYTARDDGDEPTCPMVVLINAGTASASEIVAGALQDQRRALVMGVRSFGKGSVQTILPLDDGSGLRLTTALYYTPSNRSIQATGITPDIVVPAGPAVVPAKQASPHPSVREEDLKGHFGNPEEQKKPQAPAVAEAPAQDAQIERAVEVLKSWKIFQSLNDSGGGSASRPAGAAQTH